MTPKRKDKPAGKVKLTKLMKTVLRLMGSGWELRVSTSLHGGPPRMQKDGGDSRGVSRKTVDALWDRKLLVQHYKFPTATYSLTTLGRRALKESWQGAPTCLQLGVQQMKKPAGKKKLRCAAVGYYSRAFKERCRSRKDVRLVTLLAEYVFLCGKVSNTAPSEVANAHVLIPLCANHRGEK